MNKLRLLAVFVLAAALATPDTFWGELRSTYGAGCRYSYASQMSGGGPTGGGDVGCWAMGWCYNGRNVDTSWYQHWSCQTGNWVVGGGDSAIEYGEEEDPVTYEYISYPNGLISGGTAEVHIHFANGWEQVQFFFGWDAQYCEDSPSYSGGYSYSC